MLKTTNQRDCRSCNALIVSSTYASSISKRVGRLLSLGSSALRSSHVSTGVSTNMAYADSCMPLSTQVSPGKVHELSARAARLYKIRLSVTLGFRVSSHTHRFVPSRIAVSGSYGRAFATDFFRAESLTRPALSFTTVIVTVSDHLFSYD